MTDAKDVKEPNTFCQQGLRCYSSGRNIVDFEIIKEFKESVVIVEIIVNYISLLVCGFNID